MAISMKQAAPGPIKRGSRNNAQERREVLMSNPGVWFEYSTQLKSPTSPTVLCTLCGINLKALKGINRKLLPYQVTSRRMEDGTHTIYARYVGEKQEWA